MAAHLSAPNLVQALKGALQPDAAIRKPYEEALQAWEGVPTYCTLLLQLYATAAAELPQPERLLAVLCLKNAVIRRWHARRDDEDAIPDDEKAVLRLGLLEAVTEPDRQIGAQLEVLVAQIGRLDGLLAWPELIPRLLELASMPPSFHSRRGLCFLYRVVKQQAARRLTVHRKQFFALAAELLPRLAPLRVAHSQALVQRLIASGPHDGAAWLLGHSAAPGDESGSHALETAVALGKLERQVLLHGWARLHAMCNRHVQPPCVTATGAAARLGPAARHVAAMCNRHVSPPQVLLHGWAQLHASAEPCAALGSYLDLLDASQVTVGNGR